MRRGKSLVVVVVLLLAFAGLVHLAGTFVMPETPTVLEPPEPPPGMMRATFGGGCFWCTQAVFEQLKGVQSVVCGYSGGTVKNPTYRQIIGGATGHAEAVQVTYDPRLISYTDLLEVFWETHDPTRPDRQGNDVGPMYRSVIFWHTKEQKDLAEAYKRRLEGDGALAAPIVTEITPFTELYRAEALHQNYYTENATQPYCRIVIGPKVEIVRHVFRDKVKAAP